MAVRTKEVAGIGMRRPFSGLNRAGRGVGATVLIAAAIAMSGCFAGTVPVPIQPGAEQLPSGNLKAREDLALFQLSMIRRAEDAHLAMHGKFGTMQELMKDGMINTAMQGGRGYTIDVTVLDEGGRYFAVAVPVEYGPTGRRSFYMDETGVVRGADHQGGAPKPDDPVVPAS